VRLLPKFSGYRSSTSAATNPLYSASNIAPVLPMIRRRRSQSQLEDDSSVDVLTTTSAQGAMSATFTIPRRATILADKKPHKVTIKVLKFEAVFTYTILPKSSLQAYLKASVQNSSRGYTLLSGEMSVFVDNNFVAKSEIPTTPPNDAIGIFLGADPSIKVEYRPVKKMSDQSGFISKVVRMNVERKAIITNNKDEEIVATVFDQLPKSNEAAIKVKLTEPVVPDGVNPEDVDAPLILTPANNIRWKITIKAGEKVEIPFSYSMEFPADRDLVESADGTGGDVEQRGRFEASVL